MKDNSTYPRCSLLVATYNWPEALDSCLVSAMNQTIAPDEILIADDGSTEETTQLIQEWQRKSHIPIVHVWHPDNGFRLSEIRNKAIVQAKCAYIIQIDGDILLDTHFIEDHLSSAMKKTFLCGSRATLSPRVSTFLLKSNRKKPTLAQIPIGFLLNSIRIPLLSKWMAPRFRINKIEKLRGCNMSFWKKDLLAVNGYNEDMTGWGPEDKEIAVRLINVGVEKRSLKFLAVAYHLYHQESSKNNAETNRKLLKEAFATKNKWAQNGIQKHHQ